MRGPAQNPACGNHALVIGVHATCCLCVANSYAVVIKHITHRITSKLIAEPLLL